MARPLRPTYPSPPFPQPLLESPGFLIAWLGDELNERYDRAMADLGLRSTHHAALLAIAAEGPLRQARLEDRLRVDHASFVTALGELERGGHLRRVPDPSDRRTLLLELTPEGEALVARTWEVVDRLQVDIFGAMSDTERSRLTATLAALAGRLLGA